MVAATAALALSMAYLVRPVLATQPDPLHKVTICHRTDSEKNPYVQITVGRTTVQAVSDLPLDQLSATLSALVPLEFQSS